ncbi:T9SS type A sorting domain-containing protein, partial [Arthrospira platensis SPKY1]|nr:T9SS type A sorting domain-containing protein [Arthrospira platensis SPKY1]
YTGYGGLSFFQNLLLETNTTEAGLEADVALFPNPASGIANLQLAFPEAPGELEITVIDIHGRTQRQWQLDGVADRFETQLDLSGLSPGMHFVRLRSGEQFATVRVMLE